MTLGGLEYVLVAVAGALGGAVNALAGGGTLITFPMLTAVGLSAVGANVTSSVALCPGYFGATLAQFKDVREQKGRAERLLPTSIVGGLLGGVLLLYSGEQLFRQLVPYLILLASGLLALQETLRSWMVRRSSQSHKTRRADLWSVILVGLATVYGGYFGAGMSVVVLAVLGLLYDDSLTRLNALKQSIALSTNVAAALFFVFTGKVVWSAAVVMAVGALVGGAAGGHLAGRVKPAVLRRVVVGIGLVIATVYFVR